MGWASGGKIIDEVARALMATNTDPEVRVQVYEPIVEALLEGDWDTEYESLGIDPVLDGVLRARCPWLPDPGPSALDGTVTVTGKPEVAGVDGYVEEVPGELGQFLSREGAYSSLVLSAAETELLDRVRAFGPEGADRVLGLIRAARVLHGGEG
jgi:hypothetical protein